MAIDNDWYIRYRSRFIVDVLRKCGRVEFQRIADFGCGNGRLLQALADHFDAQTAIGVDLSPPNDRLAHRIKLHAGNMFDFTPSEPCDLVISNQVFEHIHEPWLPKYFSALKRACAANGVIVISTPNRWRPSNILRRLALRKPHIMNANPGIPAEQHLGHHRECSYRELERILRQFFPAPQWQFQIARTMPRPAGPRQESYRATGLWLINLAVYGFLYAGWRPLCRSASHDHYAVVHCVTTGTEDK